MAESKNPKKLVSLRTYADDVNRVQKNREENKTPVPKNIGNVEKENDNKTSLEEVTREQAESEILIPETPREDLKGSEESIEIPPFHFIRASSPEDTTYTRDIPKSKKNDLAAEVDALMPDSKKDPKPTHTIDIEEGVVKEHSDSIMVARDSVFDAEEAIVSKGEGSIVTDRKREPFRLFPAIFSALRNWFGEEKEKIIESKKPKHTIAKSESRKDTIEEAAEQTKQAPTDDHISVAGKLKNVERITNVEELQIKDAAKVPEPTWGHVIDEEVNESDVSSEPPDTAHNQNIDTASVDTNTDTKEKLNEKVIASETVQNDNPTREGVGYANYQEKSREILTSEEVYPEPPPVVPDRVEERTEDPEFKRSPVPETKLNQVGKPKSDQSRNKMPLLTLVIVIIIAVVLGVSTSVWYFTRDTSKENTAVTPKIVSQIVATESTAEVPFTTNRDTFITNIQNAISSQSTGAIEIHTTLNGAEVSPTEILAVLLPNIPGNLARAVTYISFGGFNGNQPFILMKFTSFDVVFAGMLQMEDNLSAELSPLFVHTTKTRAIDARINNRDVRALVKDNGGATIVYGFINKNTLLITTTRNIYSTVAGLIK